MLHKIKESFEENFGKKGGDSHSDSGSYKSNTGGNEMESVTISGSNEEQYVNHHMGLYFALYLTFSMGMLGTVLATNLIEFYVFFELMLVPSFFLVAFYGYGERKRIALMFFFWTHAGAVVLLLGLLAMGLFAGGFDYDTVRENVSKIPAQWLVLIIFSLVIGFGVKLAAFVLAHLASIRSFRSSHPDFSTIISGDDRNRRIRPTQTLARIARWRLFSI